MRVQGAVIREQGQTFAVVVVKPHVVQNWAEAADAIQSFTLSTACRSSSWPRTAVAPRLSTGARTSPTSCRGSR